MSTTSTCTCCRGPRCVRVRSLDEISFEAALRRLRDELASEQRPGVHRPPVTRPLVNHPLANRPPVDRRPDLLPRPWEMTRRQFEAAAEPSVELKPAAGGVRFWGLSWSVLRHEVEFLLRCPGGPVDGYRVRVPAHRAELCDQPHRAFVEAALADGRVVPSSVLDDYPELRNGPPAHAAAAARIHGA